MKYTANDVKKMLQGQQNQFKSNKLPIINNKKLQSNRIQTVNQEKPQSLIRKEPILSKNKVYTADDIKKMLLNNPKLPTKSEQENKSLINKVSQPINNFKSNYEFGKLAEQENKAWSEYRNNQTNESLKKAQESTKVKESFIKQNDVDQGNILTKNFAQYTPQMVNQILAGLSGASETALKGQELEQVLH